MVVSNIITKVTGSYIDFVTERVFKPLGMDSTTLSPAEAAQSGKLTQTFSAHKQRLPFWFFEGEKELNAGAGGVISNVVDLVRILAPVFIIL